LGWAGYFLKGENKREEVKNMRTVGNTGKSFHEKIIIIFEGGGGILLLD
jgi:hypothetical protein